MCTLTYFPLGKCLKKSAWLMCVGVVGVVCPGFPFLKVGNYDYRNVGNGGHLAFTSRKRSQNNESERLVMSGFCFSAPRSC